MGHLRSTCMLLVLLVFCPGRAVAMDTEKADRSLRIVVMEPTPLRVPPYLMSTQGGVGTSGIQTFGIATLLSVLTRQAELSSRGSHASDELQSQLNEAGVWVAPIVVAQEFERQLFMRGHSVEISSGVAAFPGLKNRDYTFFGSEWSKAMRAWFRNTSAVEASKPIDPTTDTLEIGITSYEIVGDSLMLQVAAKLIDGTSGAVVRKVRANNAWNMPRLGPLNHAFSGDGHGFKSAFTTSTQMLVTKCLDELDFKAKAGVAGERSSPQQ